MKKRFLSTIAKRFTANIQRYHRYSTCLSSVNVHWPSVVQIQQTKDTVKIAWADGHRSTFHNIWLRDNCHCPSCQHPDAHERILDTQSIALDVIPSNVELADDKVHVTWDCGHESVYSLDFLKQKCYSSNVSSTVDWTPKKLWTVDDFTGENNALPRITYDSVMNSEEGLEEWLEMLDCYGFSIITDVPLSNGRCEQVARRISFLRETFWGDSWSVKSEPNPRNLSLTGAELFPHTDFSWSPTPPGMQFLHCLKFNGSTATISGGDSTLVDGFRIANDLRQADPQIFRLLSSIQLKHSFTSADASYSFRGSTIQLDDYGNVMSIRYNQANRDPLDVPLELMQPMYVALQEFTKMLRSEKYLLKFRLKQGEMLVFNNHRLLHGRTSYDPTAITRHLHGCYLDLEQFESRRSILKSTSSRRCFSTQRTLDSGYDTFDDTFVQKALQPYETRMDEKQSDGSCLKQVVENQQVNFRTMEKGTRADFIYQCALFQHDVETNLPNRLIGLLEKLEGDHIRLGTGAQVDLFQHSVQCATRALDDKADEEMVVMALLHDIGELLSPLNHGEIAGAILRPYIDPDLYWILSHHEIFQGYYYFDKVGGNRDTRDLYKNHRMYQPTIDFCANYDQNSFDPTFESYPIQMFQPMLARILSRKPYWFNLKHPKLGVVTIQQDN